MDLKKRTQHITRRKKNVKKRFDRSFNMVRHQLHTRLYHIVLCHRSQKDSPILQVASFSEAEIASLSAKTIAALNCFYHPVQLLLAGYLGVGVAAHPQKPARRSKIGFLDVGVCDRLYRSNGIFRFLIHWAWSLAGERCSEHPIRGGHWFVCISHTQAQNPTA